MQAMCLKISLQRPAAELCPLAVKLSRAAVIRDTATECFVKTVLSFFLFMVIIELKEVDKYDKTDFKKSP